MGKKRENEYEGDAVGLTKAMSNSVEQYEQRRSERLCDMVKRIKRNKNGAGAQFTNDLPQLLWFIMVHAAVSIDQQPPCEVNFSIFYLQL